MAAVSFGFNPSAPGGFGTNVSLTGNGGAGISYITPYVNDTGGYVFVNSVKFLNSTQARTTGDWYAVLYLLDHFTGEATELIGVSDVQHQIYVDVIPYTISGGLNEFFFTNWIATNGDIIIHPDQQVGVGMYYQNPPISATGQLRATNVNTLVWEESTLYRGEAVAVQPPAQFGDGGWTNTRMPMHVFGDNSGTLPADEIRAGLTAAESAIEGYSEIRAALTVNEPYAEGFSQIRATLVVNESLHQLPWVDLIDAGLVDPEKYMSTEVFPELIGLSFNVTKKPTFNTRVARSINGNEVRNALMQYPIWEFELTYDYLPDRSLGTTDLKTLMGFFLSRQGRFDSFLFKDPDDYVTTASPVGTGDGVTTAFYLCRSLGGFQEPVGQIDTSESYAIYVDGVLQTEGVDYDITLPNFLVFAIAPADGALITNSLTYWFRCRFQEDAQEYDKFMDKLWELQSCTFTSIVS